MTLFGWNKIEEFMRYYKMEDTPLLYLFENNIISEELDTDALERVHFNSDVNNELDSYGDNKALYELSGGRIFLFIAYYGDDGIGEFEVIKLKRCHPCNSKESLED